MAPPSMRNTPPPRTDVLREAPFTLRDTTEDDGLTLDGYGAVFNRMTVIDSWEGKFREQIAPGSMKRSFRETPPKIQFDHGRHPSIGSIPIAELRSIAEDTDPQLAPEGGAHVIARLFDNWLVQPVRDAIAARAINGMSFRFSVLREAWETADGKPIRDDKALMAELERTWYEDVPDDQLPVRTLKEVKVPEMGPVVWPAYDETSVAVRSQVIDLSRLDDPEQQKLLARAVILVDAVQNGSQRSTPVVGERQSQEQPEDTQQAADRSVEGRDAGERLSTGEESPENIDAQRSTADVGERPSKPRCLSQKELQLRNQRDRLLTLRAVGERTS